MAEIKSKQVNVLGTEWDVIEATKADYKQLTGYDGFCDETVKICVVDDYSEDDGHVLRKKDLSKVVAKNKRHELVHAFLYESGLAENSSWAMNEEIVDWIARMFPKMAKVFTEIGCDK